MTPEQAKERGIKVKPLVWMRVETYGGAVQDSTTRMTSYRVYENKEGVWIVTELSGRIFSTEKAAKAAAQADYEARILDAIE